MDTPTLVPFDSVVESHRYLHKQGNVFEETVYTAKGVKLRQQGYVIGIGYSDDYGNEMCLIDTD